MADSLFRNEKKEIKDHFRDYCSNYNSIDAVITKVRDYFSYGRCIDQFAQERPFKSHGDIFFVLFSQNYV